MKNKAFISVKETKDNYDISFNGSLPEILSMTSCLFRLMKEKHGMTKELLQSSLDLAYMSQEEIDRKVKKNIEKASRQVKRLMKDNMNKGE